MSGPEPVSVHVWGDFACFTRPEMKVERVSYPVMTPSAARGVLEGIFWKPEFRWRILSIAVLKPIRHFSILRNETTRTVAPRTVAEWMREGRHESFFIDDHRAQRNTLGLRDVAYRIDAELSLPPDAPHEAHAKYHAQFTRRVERGQCHTRPFLGCREFAAHFAPTDGMETPIDLTDELGQVLFDVRYDRSSNRGDPVFFPARLESGVLHVPQHLYGEVSG